MKRIINILKESKEPYTDITKLYENGDLEKMCPAVNDLGHTEDGHKNNFYHTMKVLKNVCDAGYSFEMKIVALFHDIGKPSTKRRKGKDDWSFHGHEAVSEKMFKKLCKENDIADLNLDYLNRMIKHHGRIKMQRDVSESAIRRLDKDVGQDIIFDVINFSICDITTKYEPKRERIISGLDIIKVRIIVVREKDEYDAWRSPLTGHIIMELIPNIKGQEIGNLKKKFEQAFRDGDIDLDEAIEIIKKEYNANGKR